MMRFMRIWMLLVLVGLPLAARDVQVAVSDATKAVIVGAAVSLRCAEGWNRTEKTAAGGVAVFVGVPQGECDMTAEYAGFSQWKGKTGGRERVEVRLEVGVLGNSTEVKAKSAGRRFVDWLTSCTRR